nr:MAG: hypothetical protein [Sanya steitz-like virus 1]UUW21118.1 MAG: hypothetical protein [Sanya steitz-like virus 1]UUW21121.1 MAG: hypothetical protein [Sanya steitz-like virus 1]
MFPSTITINDRVPAAKDFKQIALEDKGSVRMDVSTTNLSPRQMVIRHSTTSKGVDLVDRHLVQFSTVKIDTAGIARTLIVNLTLGVPRNSAIVRTDIDDLIAFIRNWSGVTANIDGLLIGES